MLRFVVLMSHYGGKKHRVQIKFHGITTSLITAEMNGKLSKDSGNILVDINFMPESREKLEHLKNIQNDDFLIQ